MRYRLPSRFRFPLRGSVAAFAVLCLGVGLLSEGVVQVKKPADKVDEKAELAEFLDDARNYAIRATKPDVVLKLHETPVLNYTNPERNTLGSVFEWLDPDGRPAAMGQFFKYDAPKGRVKKHALHSLATGPLEAKFHDKLAWTPERPGVEWKALPDAPAVAATKKERGFQLKQLSRLFKVSLTDQRDKDKPIELRRLDRPLFEYSAPKGGVSDGAIFSFVVATDPDAILLVEAFDENGKTGFRYAFARFHFWRLTATLGDKTVWEAEHDQSMVNNPFAKPETMRKVYNSFLPVGR